MPDKVARVPSGGSGGTNRTRALTVTTGGSKSMMCRRMRAIEDYIRNYEHKLCHQLVCPIFRHVESFPMRTTHIPWVGSVADGQERWRGRTPGNNTTSCKRSALENSRYRHMPVCVPVAEDSPRRMIHSYCDALLSARRAWLDKCEYGYEKL